MATYKRVTFSTVLQVAPGTDYEFEALRQLGSPPVVGGYTSNLADPFQQVGTVVQAAVTDHTLGVHGISGIRVSFDQAGIGLPEGISGTPYSVTLLGSGGDGPYTFTLNNGTLPPPLTLTAGVIAGTPNTPGAFNFSIKVFDAMGRFWVEDMSIVIS